MCHYQFLIISESKIELTPTEAQYREEEEDDDEEGDNESIEMTTTDRIVIFSLLLFPLSLFKVVSRVPTIKFSHKKLQNHFSLGLST